MPSSMSFISLVLLHLTVLVSIQRSKFETAKGPYTILEQVDDEFKKVEGIRRGYAALAHIYFMSLNVPHSKKNPVSKVVVMPPFSGAPLWVAVESIVHIINYLVTTSMEGPHVYVRSRRTRKGLRLYLRPGLLSRVTSLAETFPGSNKKHHDPSREAQTVFSIHKRESA
ncbi:hypothetical protein DFS33DRAFT_1453868 [Desarmillaria ectypa]|nr:hypothetical protein DFS33DRAFT_1453868 [Desarmillaria ectypa]